jgi:hypothetical protein
MDERANARPRLAERLCDPHVLQVAGRASHAYLAVETGGGPHVTPVLFGVTADRLWFVIARSTLKARMLEKRPGVGVLIDDGKSALVIRGDASLLDPRRPRDLAVRLSELARAPLAIPAYGLGNPAELLAFARDAARAPARAAPPNLALVSVRPGAIEIVPSPTVEMRRRTRPPGGDATGDSLRGWAQRLSDVPQEAAALALAPGPAVLGWLTPGGPLAIPAAWEPERARARVPWAVLARAGALPDGSACLCLDADSGKGPAAKDGVLLRGPGHIAAQGDMGLVSIEPDRVTYWTGFETGTVP